MGQGIFYCGRCQRQLRSSDLDKGEAVRIDALTLCRACAPADARPRPSATPPPPPSTRRIVFSRAPEAPRASRTTSWAPFAIVGGAAVVLLLIAAAASLGPRSKAPSEPRPPVVVTPPARPSPVKTEATPPSELPSRRTPAVPAPPPPDPGRELAELEDQIRPYLDKNDFVSARLTLAAARGRHGDADWTSRIDRRIADVDAARAKAAPPSPPPPLPPSPPARTPAPKPVPAAPAEGPIAWWRLDERSGAAAADASGAFPGRLEGASAWITDPPALKLSGKGGVALADDARLLQRTAGATLTAWILPEADSKGSFAPGRVATIDRGRPGLAPRLSLEVLAEGQLEFEGRAVDGEAATRVVTTAARLVPDRWQHVAVAVDYANSAVRIFIDGRRADTHGRVQFTAAETSDTPSAKAALGAWGTLQGGFFRGLISDVRLYERALDAQAIKSLASKRPSASSAAPETPLKPVGWWRLDERGGKKAADAAGALEGQLEGQAAWSERPAALRLDGQSGAVVLGENLDLLRATKAATLSAWIRPQSNSALLAPGRIATFTGSAEEGRRLPSRFSFEIADGNHLRFVGRATDGEEETRITASSARLVRERWQHAAVVVDYAGRAVRIYLDGRERAVVGAAGFKAPLTSDTPVARAVLGASETPDTRVFRGLLADVRLYARELDAAEISALAAHAPGDPDAARPERVKDGLVALYTFTEGSGDRIRDVSGVGESLDLSIADLKAARWSPGRGLEITGPTSLASAGPAEKIARACKRSHELTVEAWARPSRAEAKGPARLVTMSANTKHRNFVLGQGHNMSDPEAAVWSVRCRSSKTDGNGLPGGASPDASVAAGRLAHVVFTRAAAGEERIYIDGVSVFSAARGGDFRNWDEPYPLTLANETTKDRPWLGEYRLVAIYARALTPAEVRRNFEARAD